MTKNKEFGPGKTVGSTGREQTSGLTVAVLRGQETHTVFYQRGKTSRSSRENDTVVLECVYMRVGR